MFLRLTPEISPLNPSRHAFEDLGTNVAADGLSLGTLTAPLPAFSSAAASLSAASLSAASLSAASLSSRSFLSRNASRPAAAVWSIALN